MCDTTSMTSIKNPQVFVRITEKKPGNFHNHNDESDVSETGRLLRLHPTRKGKDRSPVRPSRRGGDSSFVSPGTVPNLYTCLIHLCVSLFLCT